MPLTLPIHLNEINQSLKLVPGNIETFFTYRLFIWTVLRWTSLLFSEGRIITVPWEETPVFSTAGYVSLLLFGFSSPLDPHLSQKLFWRTTLQAVSKLLFLLQGATKDLCWTMSKGTWEQPPRKYLLIRPPYWILTIVLNVAADWTDPIDCSITPCRNEASKGSSPGHNRGVGAYFVAFL